MNHFTYRCLRLLFGVRKWLFQQLTPAGLGVLGCLGITAIAGLGSTQSMVHLLSFLALALLALAGLGSRFIQYRFRATRALPRFGTVGEPLQYQVVIHNLTSQAQPGLKLQEIISEDFPSYRAFMQIKHRCLTSGRWFQQWQQSVAQQKWAIAHLRDLPPLPPGRSTKVMAEILPLRRGRLNLAAIALTCPDPLGLIYRRQRYDIQQSICILPKRYQLPPLNLSEASRQMGEHTLLSAIGESLEFRSLRDYRPGDPTQKIHWKSWAKVGRPIVKEQQAESALHQALILDTFQPETHSLEAHSAVFEAAIAVAISFLTQEPSEASLLDVIFAAPEARCVTVGRGLRQRAPVLETLATLIPGQCQSLDRVWPLLQDRLPRLSGCFCILIDLDQTRLTFLKQLAQSGIPIKALFLGEPYIHQLASFGDDLAPSCSTHRVAIDNLQAELLLI